MTIGMMGPPSRSALADRAMGAIVAGEDVAEPSSLPDQVAEPVELIDSFLLGGSGGGRRRVGVQLPDKLCAL
jgi:hypothetical protein